MKNSEIIEKIPNGEKTEILKDILSLPDLSGYGVPSVKCAKLDAVNAQSGAYPDFTALACSWNCDVVGKVAQDLSLRAKSDGANLIFTPDMRLCANPYKTGLTEDGFLGGAYLYAVTSSVKNSGAAVCVVGCSMDEKDIKYLDNEPDVRALYDYFYAPFECVSVFSGEAAVLTSHALLSGGYKDINSRAFISFARKAVGNSGFVLSSAADGKVILDGTQKAENNERLDEAVDKVIEFIDYCNAEKAQNLKNINVSDLALRAAEESVVLLKNDDSALPLSAKQRLCVIGKPFESEEAQASFFQLIAESEAFDFTGFAQGYTADGTRDDNLVEEAVKLAQDSDAALLFPVTGSTSEIERVSEGRLKLPANRLALIGALKKANAKIIAVLPPCVPADVSFDGGVSALLLADVNCSRGGEALINIISGKKCPSGKLARTLYDDADELFSKLKSDVASGRLKTGAFIGYRRYDTEGVKVRYPFGHGLSYVKFEYSNLTVNGETVEVTVKNTGGIAAAEVVQLYAGKLQTNILRPEKELKSFAKVFLGAGESKTVRLKLRPTQLAVYNPETGRRAIEDGAYKIYIGSSLNDIRLETQINVNGTRLKGGTQRRSDYLQSESNVIEKGYTLGPVRRTNDKFKLLRTVSLSVLLASLVGGVVLGFLLALGVTSLSYSVGAKVCFALICILCSVSLTGFLVGVGLLNNAKTEAPVIEPAKSASGVREELPFEKLFEESFGNAEHLPESKREESLSEDIQEISEYIDGSLDFKTVCSEFSLFSAERGISVGVPSVRRLFSALCASRFVLLKTNPALAPEFLKILCAYFGSAYCPDLLPEDLKGALFAETQNGAEASDSAKAVAGAMDKKHAVHVAAFAEMSLKETGEAFAPFEKYIRNPLSSVGRTRFKVPQNLWLMPVLNGISDLFEADGFPLKEGCLLDIDISAVPEKQVKTPVREPSYYQLKKLADAAKRAYCLDEEKCWKKLDKFEKLLSEKSDFKLDNKTCQRLEAYSSVYTACGGEEQDALDCAVAAKLILPAAAVSADINSRKSGSLSKLVESAFGEDMPECKKVLKYIGGSAKK
ncbi:MAG: glycoside hydrolase family 3 C-terminal domain-containing protein [Clostridia bacterium]|nr:glycoside hydrolase family 3 C-terminal domain-containing protein [Clostridia bacterium]